MATPIPADVRKFRVAFIPLAIYALIASLISIVLGYVIVFVKLGHGDLLWYCHVVRISAPGLLVIYIIGMLVICSAMFFASGFSAQGIYGRSFWGFRCFTEWSDVVKIKSLSLLNLCFLRIYSGTGQKVLWLPLCVSHQIEFRNEIRKFAPPNHPILNFVA